MIKKLLILILFLLGIVYFIFFKMNIIQNDYILKLDEKKVPSEIMDSLAIHQVISNQYIFDLYYLVNSFNHVPRGYYKLSKGLSAAQLVKKLKYGHQDPIKFTISTATFIEEIAKRAGDKMNFDSTEFMNCLMADSNKLKYGYDEKSALTQFLPNTYDFYWTASPQQFVDRWMKETQKFWSSTNLQKANNLKLDAKQAYILASLVQKEYYKKEERSRIAGVLLNRLNLNMALQVDATCKYATRDFGAKRVLNFHTNYPSEYNTYLHTGLPPGPICVPEISTIEAVLSPEKHDFIFYCADPSLNGYHIFSKTLSEHESVAAVYRQKMNTLHIK